MWLAEKRNLTGNQINDINLDIRKRVSNIEDLRCRHPNLRLRSFFEYSILAPPTDSRACSQPRLSKNSY